MPCRDDGPGVERKTVADWMLCEAMIIIDKGGLIDECSEQLLKWWNEHQADEVDRVKREAAKKLTYQERKALNIDENGQTLGKKPHPRGRR